MKLLFVNCCISQRGGASRTRALAEAFLTAFQAAHPGSEIQEVTPETLLALKPFNVEMLNRRDALAAEKAFDAPVYALARQFREADAVAVAAPFWDLSYPAALRTYIEYISANGLTYHYDEAGCHGDCVAKHLVSSPAAATWSGRTAQGCFTGGSCPTCSASRSLTMCLPAGWMPGRNRRRRR